MSDETQAPAPAKPARRPFSRRAKPAAATVSAAADRAVAMPRANSLLAKMKSRPNWESDDYVGVGQDGVDRLRIPTDIVQAHHRHGVASVEGQRDTGKDRQISARRRVVFGQVVELKHTPGILGDGGANENKLAKQICDGLKPFSPMPHSPSVKLVSQKIFKLTTRQGESNE